MNLERENISLFGNWVLVKELENDTEMTTAGGIVVPDVGKAERPRLGEVIQAGPGDFINNQFVTSQVEAGMLVILPLLRTAGVEFVVGNEKLRLFKAPELVGCIQPYQPDYRED